MNENQFSALSRELRTACFIERRASARQLDICVLSRLDREFRAIRDKSLSSAYLVLKDLASFAASNSILITARGETATSAVIHQLGLSFDCPLDCGLPMEPFIANIGRLAFEVDHERKSELVEFIRQHSLVQEIDWKRSQVNSDPSKSYKSDSTLITSLIGGKKVEYVLLGNRHLSSMAKAMEIIREKSNCQLDLASLPMDDTHVFDMIGDGDTDGVFQLELNTVKQLLLRIKPRNFQELIDTISLCRPSATERGLVEDYIKMKSGDQRVTRVLYDERFSGSLRNSSWSMAFAVSIASIAYRMAYIKSRFAVDFS